MRGELSKQVDRRFEAGEPGVASFFYRLIITVLPLAKMVIKPDSGVMLFAAFYNLTFTGVVFGSLGDYSNICAPPQLID